MIFNHMIYFGIQTFKLNIFRIYTCLSLLAVARFWAMAKCLKRDS